jgi:ABC-2 type transport system permease protein
MSPTRRLGSAQAFWLIGRLALRRQLNLWQSVRFWRKKKKTEPDPRGPEGRAAVRSGTAGKSAGRSVFSAFLLLAMGFNGFNLASSGLQNFSALVRHTAEPSDGIAVSPYAKKQITATARALHMAQAMSDPVKRKQYEDLWNSYLDRLFRNEIERGGVFGEQEESGQLKRMHKAFEAKGAAGFTASSTSILRVSAETWPRGDQAKSTFQRVLGLVVLLWTLAIAWGALGTNNKDLGQVEWSFEWLYTFPVSARVLFASKILSYSFVNPVAGLFFLPLLVMIYLAGGRGWLAVPFAIAAFVWILILVGSICTVAEVVMRKFLSLSQLKNIQALFTVFGMALLLLVIACSVSKPVDDFLVSREASWKFLRWNPFALPLYFAVPSPTAGQIRGAFGGMMVLALGGLSTALLGSEWLTRGGLIRATGPYQGRRQARAARPGQGWLRGIAAHELLLLARDRNLMVQVLIVPLLVPAYYLLTNSRIVTAVGSSARHAAMMAFAVGAYSFLNSTMPILNREDKTLWYLLSLPHSISSILLKKSMVWAVVGLLYGTAVLAVMDHFSRRLHGDHWADIFLSLYGIALYAFIAAGIGILATNVLETTRRARFRTDMVYLYTFLAALWAHTIYSPSAWAKIAQAVMSTLLAFALWQKVKDVSPYFLDPTQRPPRSIGLADGMIAALAFFVAQAVIAGVLQWTMPVSVPAQITIAYALAGVMVGSITLFTLWRQEVPGLWEKLGLMGPVKNHRFPVWQSLVQGTAWGGFAAFGAVIYIRILHLVPGWEKWKQSAEAGSLFTAADRPLWICVLAIVAAPLFEEFLFRGLIFKGLLRSTGPVLAALASAALFALVHPPISVIPVFGLGVAAALSFRRSGFLLAPIFTHAVYNTCVILFLNK